MLVAKGNLYRDIPKEKLPRFLNDGWEQVGKDGKRLKEKPDKSAAKIAELEATVTEKEAVIAEQTAKIAELEATVTKLAEKK